MKIKLRPFFKDVLLTFITQAAILLAFFLIYRLIAKNFGPEGVGEYSLIKKIVGFLQPLFLLGTGVGIPRYVAMSKNKEEQSSYLKSSLITVTITALFCLIFINLFREFFSKMFFGNIAYAELIAPLSFFLIGLILHTIIYSYLRGKLLIKALNLLQIINIVLVPIIIIIIFKNTNIKTLVTSIGIGTLLIAFIFSLLFIKELFQKIKWRQIKYSFKKIFSYSTMRVPGMFIHGSLFSLGPIIATHFTSIEEVGYLSVGQSLSHLVGSILAPIGLILLPKVGNLVAAKKEEIIEKNLNLFMGAIIQLSLFACIQLIIFADVIIKYWLGKNFSGAVPITRIIFLSIFFYAIYQAMRNILDASKFKPLNTINLILSLFLALLIGFILIILISSLSPVIGISIATTSGVACLGILTYISIRKIYPETTTKKDFKYLLIAIAINIIMGGLTLLFKKFISLNIYYFIAFVVIIATLYLFILWLLKMEWIKKLPQKIFKFR